MFSAASLTLTERQQWTNNFGSHLAGRLQWMVGYVAEHRQKPAQLKPYADSLITLIRQAWRDPTLARPVVNLILALHPLPERWGYWTAWEEVLQTGARIAARHAWPLPQAELLAHQAHLLWSCNRGEEAVTVGRHALQIAETIGAIRPLGIAGGALVSALRVLGQVEEAGELLAELLQKTAVLRPTATQADYDTAMLALEGSQALLLRQQGQPDNAIAVAERLLHRAEGKSHISPYQLGDAYVEQSTMLWIGGHYPAAVHALQTAITLFEQVEDTAAATFARGDLGLVYWSMARYDLAEQGMKQCAAYCEQVNARWRLVNEVGNLAVVYLGQGRLHLALHYANRHLDIAQRSGHAREVSRARLNRGAILVYLGDYESARLELEGSLERVIGEGRQELIAAVQLDLSLCMAGLGEGETAVQLAQNAYTMAEAMNFPGLTIIALRTLARYALPTEAKDHLRRALTLARQHDRVQDEAACLFSLAGLATNKTEQATSWQQATRLLEEMGATAWLENASPDHPPFLALML
jgi:tetratricopeptide (TPR) repeat protein